MVTSQFNLLILVLGFTASTVAGQGCNEGWHSHGGACYGLGESPATWGDAQEFCRAFNAKLAEIETAAENDYLKNLVSNKHMSSAWIGGTDILDEGTWLWVSSIQEIFTYTDWAPYQPDNSGNSEDCLMIFQVQNQGYHWNDFPCEQTANFLCEAEPSDIIIG